MDVMKTLTNPYVLAGGAALGLFLMMNGTKASNGGATPTVAYNSAGAAYNIAALGEVTDQARIAADFGKAQLQADVTKQVATMAAVTARDNNLRQVQIQTRVSNEGIIKSQIASQTAIQVDMQQQLARIQIAGLDVTKTQIQTNGAVQIAKTQAKAQQKAALYKAVGDVAGTATKLLMAA